MVRGAMVLQKSSYRQAEGGRFAAPAAAGDHGESATGGGEALVEAGSEPALFASPVVDGPLFGAARRG